MNKLTDLVIKTCLQRSPGPDVFTGIKHLNKNLKNCSLSLPKSVKRKEYFLTHSMSSALLERQMPTSDKDITRKINYRPISLTNIDFKIFKNTCKLNLIAYQKEYSSWQSGIYPRNAG